MYAPFPCKATKVRLLKTNDMSRQHTVVIPATTAGVKGGTVYCPVNFLCDSHAGDTGHRRPCQSGPCPRAYGDRTRSIGSSSSCNTPSSLDRVNVDGDLVPLFPPSPSNGSHHLKEVVLFSYFLFLSMFCRRTAVVHVCDHAVFVFRYVDVDTSVVVRILPGTHRLVKHVPSTTVG